MNCNEGTCRGRANAGAGDARSVVVVPRASGASQVRRRSRRGGVAVRFDGRCRAYAKRSSTGVSGYGARPLGGPRSAGQDHAARAGGHAPVATSTHVCGRAGATRAGVSAAGSAKPTACEMQKAQVEPCVEPGSSSWRSLPSPALTFWASARTQREPSDEQISTQAWGDATNACAMAGASALASTAKAAMLAIHRRQRFRSMRDTWRKASHRHLRSRIIVGGRSRGID